ncbi:uncharacterized protein LOC126673185 isoform X2 [Mercurialis annua]|uniref:uncharacterized protein LOC126673185 isoform X2 n=1 Tax=Mercurialis annua TaxID=3986 RepID=UPI00215EC844|nr:uncharacterized protein LOC126673185 isoform X2 [Mercurialis annua]
MDTKLGLGLGNYVSWEEVNGSSDKGRRVVRYYLKRKDGGLDLVIVGKERSLRHMSYHFVFNRNLRSSSSFKLKSRREVLDWLIAVVSDVKPLQSPHPSGSVDNSDASEPDIDNFKIRKLGQYTKEFLWIGSPWTCRKKRRHYQSFCRNGFKISVYDFVYVLAEEDKRLVAYLEDMFEDSKGNKMVTVRWYHKIDEVGIALPHSFNDREIFSSLCLQDLNVECIDGMAIVLSPHHFEKFLKEAKHTMFDPFVCSKQFDNDDARPFDITQVKGYRKQEIFRYMYTDSSISHDALKVDINAIDDFGIGPRKRHRQSNDDDVFHGGKQQMNTVNVDMHDVSNNWVDCNIQMEICNPTGGESTGPLSRIETKQNLLQYLKVGSEVEVLSQDSGIRGCWFRASIIKMHKHKVKVRYQDIKDADNEADNLEEWILSTRAAVADHFRFRFCGRPIIRPPRKFNKSRVSWSFDTGTAVDVWRHDVWQEGIVVRKESDDSFRVFFPEEKQESIVSRGDLRHSQEWLGNEWMHVKDRPDIVTTLSSFTEKLVTVSDEIKLVQTVVCETKQSEKSKTECSDHPLDSGSDGAVELKTVRDLSKDDSLAQLRWKSSKKRRRSGVISNPRLHHNSVDSKSSTKVIKLHPSKRFVIPISLKVDHENCKYAGDSRFSSAVAQPLTSLVMSR